MSGGRYVDGEWQGDLIGSPAAGRYEEGRFALHAPLPDDDIPPSQWELSASSELLMPQWWGRHAEG
jgi:hypothetical protein